MQKNPHAKTPFISKQKQNLMWSISDYILKKHVWVIQRKTLHFIGTISGCTILTQNPLFRFMNILWFWENFKKVYFFSFSLGMWHWNAVTLYLISLNW